MRIALGFNLEGGGIVDKEILSRIRDKKTGELTKRGKSGIETFRKLGIDYVKEHKGKVTVLTVHKSVIDGFGKELTKMLRDVFGDEFKLEINK